MPLPRGIRNNNVGNIEYGAFAKNHGATGSDGRFAIFATMAQGIAALASLLLAYAAKPDGKGGTIDTVQETISRFAPSNENDTVAYVSSVCAVLNCQPNDRFDFHDSDFLFWMVTAIGEHENGHDAFLHNVSDDDIRNGVAEALA